MSSKLLSTMLLRRTLSDLERNRANMTLDTMNRVYRPRGLRVGLLPRQPGMLERALNLYSS